MKKTVLVGALGLALSVQMGAAAYAAPVQSTTAFKTVATASENVIKAFVNGQQVSLRYTELGDNTLVSVRDLANALGVQLQYFHGGHVVLNKPGYWVQIQTNSTSWNVNGEVYESELAPINAAGTIFVDFETALSALGSYGVETEEGELMIFGDNLLLGSNSNPRWVWYSHVLVSGETEDGLVQDVLINTATQEAVKVAEDENGNPAVVSPDAQYGAYIRSTGEIVLVNLLSQESKVISKDTNIKSELQWSRDGKKLYFFQGDKNQAIAELTLASGEIKVLMDDKVDYKEGLKLSADGTKAVYMYNKIGSVKTDSKATVDQDAVEIDYSSAFPQISYVDLSSKDKKPVELTTIKETKLFVDLLDNGHVVYIGIDEQNDTGVLKSINPATKETRVLVSDLDVFHSAVTETGKLMIGAIDRLGRSAIYEVNPTVGSTKMLFTIDSETKEISYSKDGSRVALTVPGLMGDAVHVIQLGQLTRLTR